MKKEKKPGLGAWLSREKWGLLLLLAAAALCVGARLWLGAGEAKTPKDIEKLIAGLDKI